MEAVAVIKQIWTITSPYQVLFNNLICLSFAIAAFTFRKNANVLFIICMILFPRILDIILLNKKLLSGIVPNFSVYLFYCIYDAITILLILYRTDVIKKLFYLKVVLADYLNIKCNRTFGFIYARHIIEVKIIFLFIVSILINVIVSAEYPYRWYIDKEQLFLYYSYSTLKLLLNFLLIYWVFKLGYSSEKRCKK